MMLKTKINQYNKLVHLKRTFNHYFSHSGCVWSIDWANPCFGTIIASCGYDKKVSVW
jgi:hypothetical protein